MPTCLGKLSDFRRTDRVISNHQVVKQEVLAALQDLIEKSEGLVIEKIEDEMWATGGKIGGKGIVIGFGVASLFLLSNPVGAAIGLGGTVIGYMVWGGFKVYEMRCEEKHAEKIRAISDKYHTEVDRYTESHKKVMREMDLYSAFETTNDFKENLEMVRNIVERAEKEAKASFIKIKKVLLILEEGYLNMNDEQKERLTSTDFLHTIGKLIDGAGPLGLRATEAGSALVGALGDAVSGAPWWEVFHGLNILINSGLIVMDGMKFWELYKMRRAWGEGGEELGERQELLKNDKFEKEVTMRDLIRKIRDSINSDGY